MKRSSIRRRARPEGRSRTLRAQISSLATWPDPETLAGILLQLASRLDALEAEAAISARSGKPKNSG